VGRTKIKFSVNDLFLDGQHTPAEKQYLVRSPLFPVMATIYNTTDKAVRIGRLLCDQSVTDPAQMVMSALITTPEGFVVGKVKYHRGDFQYLSTSDGVSDPVSSPLITTTSSNYLRAKLGKDSDHVAVRWLRQGVNCATNCVADNIRTVADMAVDKAFGESVSCKPYVEFNSGITTFLSEVAMGAAVMTQMPSDMRQVFEDKYKKYEDRKNKFKASIDKAKSFFDQEKWVLALDINGGVILGAIAPHGAIAALDSYEIDGSLPYAKSGYANYTMQPKWYPNYEAIPEAYRSQVDYALMMLKVHKNSQNLFPDVGGVNQLWMDIGASVTSKIVILPK
jgi:hypothetical protein